MLRIFGLFDNFIRWNQNFVISTRKWYYSKILFERNFSQIFDITFELWLNSGNIRRNEGSNVSRDGKVQTQFIPSKSLWNVRYNDTNLRMLSNTYWFSNLAHKHHQTKSILESVLLKIFILVVCVMLWAKIELSNCTRASVNRTDKQIFYRMCHQLIQDFQCYSSESIENICCVHFSSHWAKKNCNETILKLQIVCLSKNFDWYQCKYETTALVVFKCRKHPVVFGWLEANIFNSWRLSQ